MSAAVGAAPTLGFRSDTTAGNWLGRLTRTTEALSGIVLQVITATRDWTGGSLGYTPERTKGNHIVALQFDDKTVWYLIALAVWLAGLLIWHLVDRSMARYAMEAISETRTRRLPPASTSPSRSSGSRSSVR